MIILSYIRGYGVLINENYIVAAEPKSVKGKYCTEVSMSTGGHFLVHESVDQILAKVENYNDIRGN